MSWAKGEGIKKGVVVDRVGGISGNVEGNKASPKLRDSEKHARFHSPVIDGTGRTCLPPQKFVSAILLCKHLSSTLSKLTSLLSLSFNVLISEKGPFPVLCCSVFNNRLREGKKPLPPPSRKGVPHFSQ